MRRALFLLVLSACLWGQFPMGAAGGRGGGASIPRKYVWSFCLNDASCQAAAISAPHVVTDAGSLSACLLAAGTAPTGAAGVVVTIYKNGVSAVVCTLAQSSVGPDSVSASSVTIAVNDKLTATMTTKDSNSIAKDVSVTLY